ncbi:hypothetical protein BH23ACT2_BH23ACT2_20420 [soil metagenome]
MVQPVLGPFGEAPESFVAAGASSGDIVRFALLVAVVPLVVLSVLAAAARPLGPRVRGAVQTILVAALGALAATAFARQLNAGTELRLLAGAVAGAGAAVLHRRWAPGRLFLRYASPTPLLLMAAFLFASPVAPLVRSPASAVDLGGTSDAPPVLFIVLDELPTASLMDGQGGIDRELFPNLARLAETSTWYRNHTSVASRTTVALPSLVTGRLPESGPGRPAVHAEYPDNLFSLLGATHQVHATEWATELCPRSLCSGDAPPLTEDAAALLGSPLAELRHPITSLLDEAGPLWWGQVWPTATPPSADYVVAGADDPDDLARPGLEFISGLDEATGDRPVFDYVHVPVPHQPWRLLPTGDHYDSPHPATGIAFYGWGPDDQSKQLGLAAKSRHLLQLQWTDRMLGSVFDRIEALGRWDDAVIVLTADHGVSFEPGGMLRVLTPENQAEIAWVPLLVKAPGQQAPVVNDDNVLSIDVTPTIADLVGVELGWESDGISLVDERRTDPTKVGETADPERFARQIEANLVELEGTGLGAVLDAGESRTEPAELRAWRHGRHGDLLGQTVDDLGVCAAGPEASYEPPATWSAYADGTLDRASGPLPLWHEGTVESEAPIDVAAAVDGVVVGWNVARPTLEGTVFGVLLAEPLVDGIDEVPRLYQVVDGDSCALAPLVI